MRGKRLHIMIGASLFAVLLWVIVTMRDEYQAVIETQFIVENLPAGRAIRTPVPRFVQLRCKSDGWRLAALLLGRTPKFSLDLSTLRQYKGVVTLKDVAERISMPMGIQVISMRPESVYIAMDRSAQKMVPVVFDYQLSFREGYGEVGVAVVTPESVRIKGAEDVLRSITSWKTERMVFDDIRAPIEAEVPLADTSYMLGFRPPRVRVHVDVQPFAEKPFPGVPVEVLAVPKGREIILIPPKIEIIVRGGIEQLSALSLRDFRVVVDYDVMVRDTSGFVEPVISPPPGVQVVRSRPERLQFVVRRRL
jgi:YbbR domain-containing protein